MKKNSFASDGYNLNKIDKRCSTIQREFPIFWWPSYQMGLYYPTKRLQLVCVNYFSIEWIQLLFFVCIWVFLYNVLHTISVRYISFRRSHAIFVYVWCALTIIRCIYSYHIIKCLYNYAAILLKHDIWIPLLVLCLKLFTYLNISVEYIKWNKQSYIF